MARAVRSQVRAGNQVTRAASLSQDVRKMKYIELEFLFCAAGDDTRHTSGLDNLADILIMLVTCLHLERVRISVGLLAKTNDHEHVDGNCAFVRICRASRFSGFLPLAWSDTFADIFTLPRVSKFVVFDRDNTRLCILTLRKSASRDDEPLRAAHRTAVDEMAWQSRCSVVIGSSVFTLLDACCSLSQAHEEDVRMLLRSDFIETQLLRQKMSGAGGVDFTKPRDARKRVWLLALFIPTFHSVSICGHNISHIRVGHPFAVQTPVVMISTRHIPHSVGVI